MKKIFFSSIVLLMSILALQAQDTKKYGAQFGIFYQIPTSSAIGGFVDGEYQFDTQPAAHHVAAVAGITVAFGDESILALGAGYKENITYERGGYLLYGGLHFNSIGVEAKLLPSQFEGYPDTYEVGISFYPEGGSWGIGAFYSTEYNCTILGAKISYRLFDGGSSGKPARNCW